MTVPIETEFKLTLAPEHASQLRQHPYLSAITSAKPTRRKLYSVYYDTPQFDLRRAGLALRLRRECGKWTQTLKSEGVVSVGLHQRPEWETPIRNQNIDFTILGATPYKKIFRAKKIQLALGPIFVTDFWRTTTILTPTSAGIVELCVDRGKIIAGHATEMISEIELELRSGLPLTLFTIALELLDTIPLRPDPMSKAQRGYDLAVGTPKLPVKFDNVALGAHISVGEIYKKIAFACLGQLQTNENGMLAGNDIEYLHQMRVAIRRLRALISLFSHAIPQTIPDSELEDLKWLSDKLGSARDWGVVTQQQLPDLELAFPDHPGIRFLGNYCRERCDSVNSDVKEIVLSSRYSRLLVKLAAWLYTDSWADQSGDKTYLLNTPIKNIADSVITKLEKKIEKLGMDRFNFDATQRHRLRIAVKKLRYALDYLSVLYPKKRAQSYLQALQSLQEVLGKLNDITTMNNLLSEIKNTSLDLEETQQIVCGWQTHKEQILLQELDGALERFYRLRPLV